MGLDKGVWSGIVIVVSLFFKSLFMKSSYGFQLCKGFFYVVKISQKGVERFHRAFKEKSSANAFIDQEITAGARHYQFVICYR